MKLVYYGIPGRVFWTRGMLHYYNVEFEDKIVKGDANEVQQNMENNGFIKQDLPGRFFLTLRMVK